MQAIQVSTWGQPPTYHPSIPLPPAPSASQIRLRVLASALHRIVRSQASGTHYTSASLTLPFTPGVDGVGLCEDDGKRYYFVSIQLGGGFAEYINVEKNAVVELGEGADAIQVAGLVNPGMSSWMALKARCKDIDLNRSEGWSVLILGVTTQSGKIAVNFARHLGATRIIGVARDTSKMSTLNLDATITLTPNPVDTDWSPMGDVDIVLDYLSSGPLLSCLTALKSSVPTQVVSVGSMAGLTCDIPSSLLRSKDITIRGSGPGAWRMRDFKGEVAGLVRAVERLDRMEGLAVRGLRELGEVWGDEGGRTVFVGQ